MKTCSLNEFMDSIRPWISDSYIRRAHINSQGDFVLEFTDGVKNAYRIDDCTRDQLEGVLADLKNQGVLVSDPES